MLVLRTAAPSGREQIADTGEEHAVHRFFLACEDRLVEQLWRHAARAREYADPVLPPRLHGHDDVLSRLRCAPEVVEQAPQRLALPPARAERAGLRDAPRRPPRRPGLSAADAARGRSARSSGEPCRWRGGSFRPR